MKSQHTPGPWECSHTSNYAHDYRLHLSKSNMPFEGNDTARANARLIAAAPDLLDTLERAIARWPEFDSDAEISGAELVDWFGAFRENCKTAVNKARGRL